MNRIIWLVIVIITCQIQSKFIDNELREFDIPFNLDDSRQINLDDNEIIGEPFETSQFELKFKTQQSYQGLPIFGATLVVEQDPHNPRKTIPISGKWYDKTDIDKLVPSIKPQVADEEALNIALRGLNIDADDVYSKRPSKLYIYYHNSYPYLCWIIKVSYKSPAKENQIHHPMVIIDALNGNIFEIYDESYNVIEGCGDGGNLKTGLYQYCVDLAPLLINENISPVLENDVIQVFENHNYLYTEHSYATKVTCSGLTNPTNGTNARCNIDDVYTNGAYCPACDLFAFANVAFEMFAEWTNATYPISSAFIPMRLYMHVGSSWANANYVFATGEMNFGDGDSSVYPLTVLDIIVHEIAHGYTDQGSDLIYSGESGGMNEAFSDIAGVAGDYWFFGRNDWELGNEIFKSNEALRYLHDPPLDGVSIDHYSNYYGQNVHYTSGLYNKAAYNLNANGNWTMEQIFRVFAWANLFYWTPDSTFNEGINGLHQALFDIYDDNTTDVFAMVEALDDAFFDVGLARVNATIPDPVCGYNRFCHYPNITGSPNATTVHTVHIQADDDSAITYFDIYFTVKGYDCIRPTLSFSYELIDYDASTEYIDVFDNDGLLINRCQGGYSCGTFDSLCINNYDLGVSGVKIGETYKISVVESAEVDDLCGTGPTINAFVTLQCQYGTLPPTTEPTSQPTMEPTAPSNPPTTSQPTPITLNPTPYPTNFKINCGVNTFCYIVDIYPSLTQKVENTVIIQNPDDYSDTYFNVFFIIHGNDCVYPRISFEHELIDYDSTSEYIDLFDDNDNLIMRCQGAFICNEFSTCISDYDIGVDKISAGGEHYKITILESYAVDSQCYPFHTNSINARLKFTCDAGTVNPTTSPTTTQPTQATANPTPAPTSEGEVRLVDGTASSNGRVEVFHNGTWGTICDDSFLNTDAGVVCRSLGWGDGTALYTTAVVDGIGQIWLDEITCIGTEETIGDCYHSPWGHHDCGHYEDVGVSCYGTRSPTQTTNAPTTSAPTQVTNAPTQSPKVACGTNKWCFYIPVTPNPQNDTEWNVAIQNEYVYGARYFDIYFMINGADCVNPRLSFTYERIDYDSSTEYIDVFDNNANLIQRCGAGTLSNLCNSYGVCLSERNVGVNQIAAGNTYKISLTESGEVHAFCTTYHPFSINANAILSCQGGTIAPTAEPTTYAPTPPTEEPTQSPLVVGEKVACGTNKYCYTVPIYPSYKEDTQFSVNITNYDDNVETYFDIFFVAMDDDCLYPSISFEFEEIDFASPSTEYIDVFGNDVLIQRCTGISDANCGNFIQCLSNYSLSTISMGDRYKVSLTESVQVDAFCGHPWSINAKLTISCSKEDVFDNFNFSSTMTAQYCDSIQGIIACDGSVTSQLIEAESHCYSFQPKLPNTTFVTFSNCASEFDTKLFVYNSNYEWISQIFCDGDDCGSDKCSTSYREVFSIPDMNINETYFVIIAAYAKGGNYTIDIQCDGRPPTSAPTTQPQYWSPPVGTGGVNTWSAAVAYCANNNAQLATFRTIADVQAIKIACNDAVPSTGYCWGGWDDPNLDTLFTFVDGTQMDDLSITIPWAPGEPGSSSTSSNCGCFRSENSDVTGYIYDCICSSSGVGFVCETTGGTYSPTQVTNAPSQSPTSEPTVAAPSSATQMLQTTFAGGNSQNGNMFDICAINDITITSFDVHCQSGGVPVEVYVVNSTNQSYDSISSLPAFWTLIHMETAMCSGTGFATVLNPFNRNTVPVRIQNGDCRGFYVTRTDGGVLLYTDGVAVGRVYASNGDMQFKEGIGKAYAFGSEFTPRIWNGNIYYYTNQYGTTEPTAPSVTLAPTMEPTLGAVPLCCACTQANNVSHSCPLDTACESLICAQDSFCCTVQWDGICASAALKVCNNATLTPTQPGNATMAPLPYCQSIQATILCDESAIGTSTNGEVHCYKFVLNTVSTVTFSDCDSDFDPKLSVYNDDGEWISQPYCDGDDCGSDKCATPFREVFSIPNMSPDDIYYVLIAPISVGGNYKIDIQCNATNTMQPTSTTPIPTWPWYNITSFTTTMTSQNCQSIQATLSCDESAGGTITNGGSHCYAFVLNTVSSVTFSDCATAFDSTLFVYNSNNEWISEPYCDGDDCGFGELCNNSLREAFTIPNMSPDDTYYVRIAPFSGGAGGDYTIDIQCNNATGTMQPTPTANYTAPANYSCNLVDIENDFDQPIGVCIPTNPYTSERYECVDGDTSVTYKRYGNTMNCTNATSVETLNITNLNGFECNKNECPHVIAKSYGQCDPIQMPYFYGMTWILDVCESMVSFSLMMTCSAQNEITMEAYYGSDCAGNSFFSDTIISGCSNGSLIEFECTPITNISQNIIHSTDSDSDSAESADPACTVDKCYYEMVTAETTITSVTNTDESDVSLIDIYYTFSSIYECESPQLTFEYEKVDIDRASEYITVEANDIFIADCGSGENQCGEMETCFENIALDTKGIYINSGETLKINIFISETTNALCETDDHRLYTINAVVKLSCDAVGVDNGDAASVTDAKSPFDNMFFTAGSTMSIMFWTLILFSCCMLVCFALFCWQRRKNKKSVQHNGVKFEAIEMAEPADARSIGDDEEEEEDEISSILHTNDNDGNDDEEKREEISHEFMYKLTNAEDVDEMMVTDILRQDVVDGEDEDADSLTFVE